MIEGASGVTGKGIPHGLPHGGHARTSRETCETHASKTRGAREPIDTAKAPFSPYLSDEGVTRGVATELNF